MKIFTEINTLNFQKSINQKVMMKQKTILILFLSALFVGLSSTVTYSQKKQIWAKSYMDQKAPEIVVEKWLSDKPEYKGKFIIIDYWATSCRPCVAVIPELNRFSKKFKNDLVVIGITSETEAQVKRMITPKIEYYVASDPTGRMAKQLKIRGIPHVIVIDPDGIVRWEGLPTLGGHELTEKVVADIIKKYKKK